MAPGASALLAFRIADRRYALEAARVAEVLRRPPVTRVPHAPPSLVGVAALRGRVMPVVALGQLLGAPGGAFERVIVLTGDAPVGLAVDEVIGLQADDRTGPVDAAQAPARVPALDEMLEAAFAGSFRRGGARSAPQPSASPAPPEAALESLLTFDLAGQPYALPLGAVREVIATPPGLATLPHADAAMLGVAALRGALTPIVSTRAVLGLPPAPPTAASRVVVAAVGEARVGFAVDRVDAILHAPASAIGPVPKVLNRGAGEARVAAMLRTASGGLVSVLEPERLFAEESLAQILEDGRRAEGDDGGDAVAESFQRFLIFQLGEETYGLDIAAVEEVTAMPEQL